MNNKSTFAEKVKSAITKYEGLAFSIHQFKHWKYLAKHNPSEFRIKWTNKTQGFVLEQSIIVYAGYMDDDSYTKWKIIEKSEYGSRNTIGGWIGD